MFGYIKPYKPNMRVKEFELYKGIYCSLCKEMGKQYGFLTRFLLSYDCTFIVLLSQSLKGNVCATAKSSRCCCNPLKKCKYIQFNEENSYKIGSAVTILLTYYKIQDDILDNHFFKTIPSRILRFVFKKAFKKAKNDYARLNEKLKKAMELQRNEEKNSDSCLDSLCEPTALILQAVFEELSTNEREKTILSNFGYFLGRWVYMIDGADDILKDLKEGSYNPFVKQYNLSIKPNTQFNLTDSQKQDINASLNASISNAILAYNLLDIYNFKEIVDNILLEGLADIQKRVIFKNINIKNLKDKDEKHIV